MTSKLYLVLIGFISGVSLLVSFGGTRAGSDISIINSAVAQPFQQAQLTDQMVCHIGKILTVLNKNYSSKSLTCLKRSSRMNQSYNNLAEVYAEGWIVVDINNSNTWVFNK